MTTMDLEDLAPSVGPSRNGTGKELSPSPRRVKYGGDYETRLRRSSNKSLQNFSMAWEALPFSECDAVENFLENTYGVTAFNITGCEWIDPDIKYVYTGMSRANSGPTTDTISVKLERVFA